LKLLVEDRFPAVWQPPAENEQTRQLLLHRCRLVRLRTRVMNQLDAMAKNEGLCGQAGWSRNRRQAIESLPLPGWHAQRRTDLLALLDELDKQQRPLGRAHRRRKPLLVDGEYASPSG
jgi:transposase